jgi:transcriptional regulator with XRE-family HTH domain
MQSSFALDLKAVRRRSGLTQHDCGHLLGSNKQRVASLEAGRSLPSVPEICRLSLIFGRSFESLFGAVFEDARTDLGARVATLPARKNGWMARFNRQHMIEQINKRLADHPASHV